VVKVKINNMSYKNLEIWKLANELVLEIHEMTLRDLPKFKMYENGSQVRRSVKSVKSNFAEGFGWERCQQDYIHFLVLSFGSLMETNDHLETLHQTKSLKDEKKFLILSEKPDKLGRKLNLFIQAVDQYLQIAKRK
jgi:four helix bundle protein